MRTHSAAMPHCQQSAAVVVAAAAAAVAVVAAADEAAAAVAAAVVAYLLPDTHQKWVPATPESGPTQHMFQSPQLCLAKSYRYGHKMHRAHSKCTEPTAKCTEPTAKWQPRKSHGNSVQMGILGLHGNHVLRWALYASSITSSERSRLLRSHGPSSLCWWGRGYRGTCSPY